MNTNIPEFLKMLLKEQYGKNLYEQILNGFNQTRKTTFRVNTLKAKKQEIEEELNSNAIKFKKIEIIKNAYEINKNDEEKLRELAIYKNGKIYLQSLSSMLPPIILEPKKYKDILDMAAAPGGKTTQMAALSNNEAHITACELNKIRMERLKYNVEKQGASCVYCMQKDSRTIDDFFSFDQILLDAPCSGSGTINSNDNSIKKYFTEKLIQKSIKSQKDLINKAIKILKPGGEIVYSTCSILSCENEDIISKVLKEKKVEIIPINHEFIEKLPQLPTRIMGTLCIMPNEYYEGFFIAKLRKI